MGYSGFGKSFGMYFALQQHGPRLRLGVEWDSGMYGGMGYGMGYGMGSMFSPFDRTLAIARCRCTIFSEWIWHGCWYLPIMVIQVMAIQVIQAMP